MSSVTVRELIRENRNFRLFWAGQIVSQLGDWFSLITVQALLLKHTGQSASVAGYMVASMLPHLALGPLAGVLVDRLPRKAVMIVADLARAGIALGLLGFRGPETVWLAYTCVAGLACFAAVFEPARIAVLPSITSERELVTANALSAVTWSLLLTSGALAGGVVARFFGNDVAFLLNSVSFLGSAVLLGRAEIPPTDRGGSSAGGFGAIRKGLHYVLGDRDLRVVIAAKLGWGLAGGIQSLIPVYAQQTFPLPGDRDGQLALSLLFAAGGLGTAVGPIVARRVAGSEEARLRWAIAFSFVFGGLFLAGVSRAGSLGWVAGLLFLSRFHGSIVWVFSTVLLQMRTADAFRGRVFAAEGSLFTLGMMLSNVAATQVLDRRMVPISLLPLCLGGVSLLVGAGWTSWLLWRRPRSGA